MEFEAMTAEQYRALSTEEFEQRRSFVAELCMSEDCTIDPEVLRAEANLIVSEATRRNTATQLRSLAMNTVANGGGSVITRTGGNDDVIDGDVTTTLEYRTAFMNHVLSGTAMPVELREDANTLTSDVGTVIPTQLVNRIVERMDHCGMILPLVSRTSFKGGIVIPTSTVKPVASWVNEGAGSDRQKKTTGSITFAYHKLRCEISMSMEVGTMALSAFEAKFVQNVADAMVIAVEKAILAGDGTDRPTGILDSDNIVSSGTGKNVIEWEADVPTYAELLSVEAEILPEFEGSTRWCMTKKQFYKILSMTDDDGQPIARVDHGINGQVERTILGRSVVIHPYATEMGTHLAFLFSFGDYLLNTIYDMGIQRKQDWDTEDLLTKAVMSVDGKCVDTGSLLVIDKAAEGVTN